MADRITLQRIIPPVTTETDTEWVLPPGWHRCFQSPAATPIWHPERRKITGFATRNPYRVIFSSGRAIRSWVPEDVKVSTALQHTRALTFATVEEAEEAYAANSNPENMDMVFP